METQTIYGIAGLAAGFVIGRTYYKTKVDRVIDKLTRACRIIQRTYTNEGNDNTYSLRYTNDERLADRDDLIALRDYLKKYSKRMNFGIFNLTADDLGRKIEGTFNEQRAAKNEERIRKRE